MAFLDKPWPEVTVTCIGWTTGYVAGVTFFPLDPLVGAVVCHFGAVASCLVITESSKDVDHENQPNRLPRVAGVPRARRPSLPDR